MSLTRTVVASARNGDRWAVREVVDGPDLSTHQRKVDAVTAARAELSSNPAGGVIEVHLANGRTEYRRQVPAATVAGGGNQAGDEPESLDTVLDQVTSEKDKADQSVEVLLEWGLPLLLLLVGPAAQGLVSAGVAEQRSFFGLFFATLAWSLGIAAFVVILLTKAWGEVSGGPQLALLAAACLGGGALLANMVGYGAYGVTIPWGEYGSTPVGWVMPFVDAAVATFGSGGAILGALSGLLAGGWATRIYNATAHS